MTRQFAEYRTYIARSALKKLLAQRKYVMIFINLDAKSGIYYEPDLSNVAFTVTISGLRIVSA